MKNNLKILINPLLYSTLTLAGCSQTASHLGMHNGAKNGAAHSPSHEQVEAVHSPNRSVQPSGTDDPNREFFENTTVASSFKSLREIRVAMESHARELSQVDPPNGHRENIDNFSTSLQRLTNMLNPMLNPKKKQILWLVDLVQELDKLEGYWKVLPKPKSRVQDTKIRPRRSIKAEKLYQAYETTLKGLPLIIDNLKKCAKEEERRRNSGPSQQTEYNKQGGPLKSILKPIKSLERSDAEALEPTSSLQMLANAAVWQRDATPQDVLPSTSRQRVGSSASSQYNSPTARSRHGSGSSAFTLPEMQEPMSTISSKEVKQELMHDIDYNENNSTAPSQPGSTTAPMRRSQIKHEPMEEGEVAQLRGRESMISLKARFRKNQELIKSSKDAIASLEEARLGRELQGHIRRRLLKAYEIEIHALDELKKLIDKGMPGNIEDIQVQLSEVKSDMLNIQKEPEFYILD